MNDIRVNVWKVLYDAQTGSSVVLLQTETEDHVLPIWVGQAEALSIAVASEKVSLGRPMTHDLLKTVVETAGLSVIWVRIHDLIEGTFFSTIRFKAAETEIDVDARPSDAIALALRCDAPVFISERVLAEILRNEKSSPFNTEELADDFLANLPDEIFGKYKM